MLLKIKLVEDGKNESKVRLRYLLPSCCLVMSTIYRQQFYSALVSMVNEHGCDVGINDERTVVYPFHVRQSETSHKPERYHASIKVSNTHVVQKRHVSCNGVTLA